MGAARKTGVGESVYAGVFAVNLTVLRRVAGLPLLFLYKLYRLENIKIFYVKIRLMVGMEMIYFGFTPAPVLISFKTLQMAVM